MKKIIFLCLTLLLVGCQKKVEEDSSVPQVYQDGTYMATVQGYASEFEISVELKEDKIVKITIGENEETPSIGGVAASQMAQKIQEANSTDVDLIAGATYTSTAIKQGVENALSQAKAAASSNHS